MYDMICLHSVADLKAHTHTPILARSEVESAVESADCTTESADYTTDYVKVGRLSLLNMFYILNPLELAIGRRQIGLVGMGLKGHHI